MAEEKKKDPLTPLPPSNADITVQAAPIDDPAADLAKYKAAQEKADTRQQAEVDLDRYNAALTKAREKEPLMGQLKKMDYREQAALPTPGGSPGTPMFSVTASQNVIEEQRRRKAIEVIQTEKQLSGERYDPTGVVGNMHIVKWIQRLANPNDKIKALQQYKPGTPFGIRRILLDFDEGEGGDTDSILVFKWDTTDLAESWKPVDGARYHSPVSDIAGEALGEVTQMKNLGAMLPILVTGAHPAGIAASEFVGTILGGQIDEAVNRSQGFTGVGQLGRVPGDAFEGALAAGFGVGAGKTAEALGISDRLMKEGVGADGVTAMNDLVRFQRQEGIKPLTRMQMTDNPVWKSVFTQVNATAAGTKQMDDLMAQNKSLMEAFAKRGRDVDMDAFSMDELKKLEVMHLKNLYNIVNPKGRTAKTRATQAKEIKAELRSWNARMQDIVDGHYSRVLDSAEDGEVAFNLTPMLKQIQAINARKAGLVRGAKVNPETGRATKRGKTGKMEVPVYEATKYDPQFQKLLDDWSEHMPSEVVSFRYKKQDISAYEQLKRYRTSLSRFMDSKDGNTRGAAKELWREATKVLENPVSDNPAFKSNWAQANKARTRFETAKKYPLISQALKAGENVDDIIKSWFDPSNTGGIIDAMTELPPHVQKNLREGVVWDIARKAFDDQADGTSVARSGGSKAIKGQLDEIQDNPEYRKQVLGEQNYHALRRYEKASEEFEEGIVGQLLDKELVEADEFIPKQLADRLNTGKAEEIAEGSIRKLQNDIALAGGPHSEFGRAIKASVFLRVLQNATTLDHLGRSQLDLGAFITQIDRLNSSKVAQVILNEGDRKALRMFEAYARSIDPKLDTGGSIKKGALASRFLNPRTMPGAVYTITKNQTLARILASPKARIRLMRGDPGAMDTGKITALVSAMGVVSGELEAQEIVNTTQKMFSNQPPKMPPLDAL